MHFRISKWPLATSSVAALVILLGWTLIQRDSSRDVQELPEVQQFLMPEGKTPKRYDQPDLAIEHYRAKRIPEGMAELPLERALDAKLDLDNRLRFSSRSERFLSDAEARAVGDLETWEPLGPGNIGGRTRAMVIDPDVPDIMIAGGVSGGIWRTVNGGSSWTAVDDLMANLAVNSMAMDPANPDVIYAGTGEGFFNSDAVRGAGIFKSVNGGLNWSQLINTGNSSFHYVNDIVVSHNDSNIVYAATRSGVFRSTNAGSNWSQVFNPLANGGCTDLVIRTDTMDDVVFAACGTFQQATIYRNSDAGGVGTWDAVFTEANMGRTSLALAPSNQDTIYALSASVQSGSNFNNGMHAVFRSTDGGTMWTAQARNTGAIANALLLTNPAVQVCSGQFFNQGWYDNVIAVDPVDPDVVYAGGIDMFRSDNAGVDWGITSLWWRSNSASEYLHADQHGIFFHPDYDGVTNTRMFVTNDGGVYRTDNPQGVSNVANALAGNGSPNVCTSQNTIGVVWTSLNNSYGVTQFYHGVPYPDGETFFGGTQDNGTVLGNTTVRGPDDWIEILGGDGGYTAIDPTNTNILYAENTGISIQKSTNGGNSFSSATTGISDNGGMFINPFTMDPSDPDRPWTGGFFLWRTDNAAANWSRASAVTVGVGSVSAIAVAPTNSDYVLAGMSDGFIHRNTSATTTGSGDTWPSVDLFPIGSGYVSGLEFDPNNELIAYATVSTFGDAHVWRSTDGGASWTAIADAARGVGFPDIPAHDIAIHPLDGSRLYVGTDLGVLVSTDTGASWNPENTGFANVVTETVSFLEVDCQLYLFAFTHGRGAWRVPVVSTALSVASANVGNAGSSGNFNLTALTGCNWMAVSSQPWLTITSADSGTGSATIQYSVAANMGAARSATISVAGETFTVNQDAGISCTYDIAPTQDNYTSAGGSGNFALTTQPGCPWTAVSNDAWITVTSAGSGTGSTTVNYTVAANTGGARTGTITVGGETFTVNQDAAPCSYSLNPTSASPDENGGPGSFALTTAAHCAWTAVSNDPWITVTSAGAGTGSATINYTVAANTGGARTGTITAGGETFTVNQAALVCVYAVAPTSADYGATGGNGSFNLTTQSACDWNAVSNDAWITITSADAGTGNATIQYSVDPLPGDTGRMGTITVEGQTFTVNQLPCGPLPAEYFQKLGNWPQGETVQSILATIVCQEP